jgi:hypothetical protein
MIRYGDCWRAAAMIVTTVKKTVLFGLLSGVSNKALLSAEVMVFGFWSSTLGSFSEQNPIENSMKSRIKWRRF